MAEEARERYYQYFYAFDDSVNSLVFPATIYRRNYDYTTTKTMTTTMMIMMMKETGILIKSASNLLISVAVTEAFLVGFAYVSILI